MIKHHPTKELMVNYVLGELPASLTAAVAVHCQFCSQCQQQVNTLTEQQAHSYFEQDADLEEGLDTNITLIAADKPVLSDDLALDDIDIEAMISKITASAPSQEYLEPVAKTLTIRNKHYTLPRALEHLPMGRWSNIGKLTRSRVMLDEGEIHTSLLHIAPGGGVPEHTHDGFELTLLLSGSFHDEMGEYVPGDFIMLDGQHQHNPVSEHGCLCYTVANAPQHFTQGINRLLNPIGSFIY